MPRATGSSPHPARFDDFDFNVFVAHSIMEINGGCTFDELQRHHDGPLPIQRVQGMARRGLIERHVDGSSGIAEWFLTAEGVRLAHEYRDRLEAADAA